MSYLCLLENKDMKNKFNLISSKEWLPFQKSWFRYEDDERLYRENIRFFTKADELKQPIAYFARITSCSI